MSTKSTPVVTLSEHDELSVDGKPVGEVGTRTDGSLAVWLNAPSMNASELAAIAKFLDQLAGANLLSGVRYR